MGAQGSPYLQRMIVGSLVVCYRFVCRIADPKGLVHAMAFWGASKS